MIFVNANKSKTETFVINGVNSDAHERLQSLDCLRSLLYSMVDFSDSVLQGAFLFLQTTRLFVEYGLILFVFQRNMLHSFGKLINMFSEVVGFLL